MQAKEAEAIRDSVRKARASSAAAKLLAGAGSASLTAFKLEEQPVLGAITHGVTSDGTLVVAAVDHSGGAVFGSAPQQVRMDIVLEAPEISTRIVAATLHMLGTLRWMSAGWERDAATIERLPEHVAELALAPGGRLGVVHATSLLIHEAAGVTRLSAVTAVGAAALRSEEASFSCSAEMFDLAMSLNRDQLSMLASAIIDGYGDGYILCEKTTASVCGGLLGQTFVVDVDQDGITLIHVGHKQTTVVFALFGAEAPVDEQTTTVDRCRAGLARLLSV